MNNNIYLEAVKRDGLILKYIINQTETTCLAAVKENGRALKYVTDQTKIICLEAIKEDAWNLQWGTRTNRRTLFICRETERDSSRIC